MRADARLTNVQAAREDFLRAEQNAVGKLLSRDFNDVRVRAYRRWLEAVRAFRTSGPLADPAAEVSDVN